VQKEQAAATANGVGSGACQAQLLSQTSTYGLARGFKACKALYLPRQHSQDSQT
jgi:hypothetical protein